MKRKYIVAVLGLLTLGVVSTFALSYVNESFTETWGAQYSVTYSGASLEVDNPDTSLPTGQVVVQFDADPLDPTLPAVQCSFTVKAYKDDGSGGYSFIQSDGSSSEITVSVSDDAGTTYTDYSTSFTSGSFNKQLTMTSYLEVDKVKITLINTNIQSEYEKLEIIIEDDAPALAAVP